jgi:hypothetical protein
MAGAEDCIRQGGVLSRSSRGVDKQGSSFVVNSVSLEEAGVFLGETLIVGLGEFLLLLADNFPSESEANLPRDLCDWLFGGDSKLALIGAGQSGVDPGDGVNQEGFGIFSQLVLDLAEDLAG